MDRRQWMGALGVGAAGLAVAGQKSAIADHDTHENDEHLSVLGKCAKVCNEAAHHCLQKLASADSSHEQHAKSHQMTIDCQEFCVLTATLMARSSPLSKYAHQACADACRDCAAACEGQPDEIMKQCVQACRECEKACRKMMAGHHDHSSK